MGVPGFFSWLLKKSDNIIIDKVNFNIDSLYIDANCLFHPQCFKVLELSDEKNIEKLEILMIKRIINYINFIIDFVNPNKNIFIAVDGVAPMAKLNQQRKRRYKSDIDNKLRNEIKKKHNIPIKDYWSNVIITPGTVFMEKLHSAILDNLSYIKNKFNKCKIIYSSYHTIGEGEHKILKHIKNNSFDNYLIYGLDADLFFLAMASNKNNIYLLREEELFKKSNFNNDTNNNNDIINNVNEKFVFVSIDNTKNLCFNIICSEANKFKFDISNIKYKNNIINDFIFLCYLLGNDFLPHLPSINIKNNGIDILISKYIDTLCELSSFLTYDNINISFLKLFFHKLALDEDYYFKHTFQKYINKINNKKHNIHHLNLYEIDIWNFDNLKNIYSIDDIHFGDDSYKFRYYEKYFKSIENQNIIIYDACLNYTQGLFWIFQYYFDQCYDYQWQYQFTHAPFVSDISYFLNYYTSQSIQFKTFKKPFSIFQQLLSVIHPNNKYILPIKYQNLFNDPDLIDLFPISFQQDTLYKEQLWNAIPIIPIIDLNRILLKTINIPINNDEKKRNSNLDEFII